MYTVKEGDWLSKIAGRYYGDVHKWSRIYDANRDQISDPDKIRPGMVLKIPLDK
ncbi:MAG: LysM peptidoglycan-binding domain-containing protein [Cytophagales bacterium]|jgi:nucleoid-associated protein YgaU|nr:LysM peptidoglycan-binding domain-containing protein [Cytophagales bacterium]